MIIFTAYKLATPYFTNPQNEPWTRVIERQSAHHSPFRSPSLHGGIGLHIQDRCGVTYAFKHFL